MSMASKSFIGLAIGLGVIAFASAGFSAETETDASKEWSFRHHVLPVLSKAGCNGGGCHGALAGKGGYDPVSDHYNITRDAGGRRTEYSDPARSLLLTKPTTAIRHKGGKRLEPGSKDYQVVAEWIAAGAKPPTDADRTLERLEVTPKTATLKKGDSQSMTVRAHYSDGSVEDVTDWAKYTSADETVAEVDEKTGEVKVIGHGEGAITVWFSSRVELARVTSPYPNSIAAEVYESIAGIES
jgi:hypothetical protein